MQSSGAKQSAEAQQEQVRLEQQVEAQKHQQMALEYRRNSMQLLRNQQRTRAMALQNATAQGAQQGSGLQGGYGQISGDAGNNMLGLNQNFEIGNNIFGLNAQISQQKILQSQAQSTMMTGNAISNLGGSLLKATPSLASIGQNAANLGTGMGMGNFMSPGSGSFSGGK